MNLNKEQMAWVDKLLDPSGVAKDQEANDDQEAKRAAVLSKFRSDLDQNFAAILAGFKISVEEKDEKGKTTEKPLWRKDLDPRKMPDARDDIAIASQKDEEKFNNAQALLKQIVGPVHDSNLFSDPEMITEVYDPLVRRGIPETFIGEKFSRTHAILKGSFEEYGKRLQKEELKTSFQENKDFFITMAFSSLKEAGAVMTIDGATQLLESQQQFTAESDPIHIFQQNYGITANDTGETADNLQKAAQTWALLQNVLDATQDVVLETGSEAVAVQQEQEAGKQSARNKENARKLAPAMARSVVAAVGVNVTEAFAKLGAQASGIFGEVVKQSEIASLLGKKEVKDADITKVVTLLGDGIEKALLKLLPDNTAPTVLKEAADEARTGLGTLNPAEIAAALKAGNYQKAVEGFVAAAAAAGTGMKTKLGNFVDTNADAMKQKAQDYVDKALLDEQQEDKDHKKDEGHDPDWVQDGNKKVCLRCAADPKDVDTVKAFGRLLDLKIAQLKKEQAYMNLAVAIGGMAFDVAANFVAPLAAGGALLRMSRYMFAAVKRWIDFNNFCDNTKAMINAASPYSGAMKGFRNDAAKQGTHYSINAACEGVKIVGALVQCSPMPVAGIGMCQAASGVQGIEAVIYELEKLHHLKAAWQDYKQALAHPDNRRLGLIAIRGNPTLRKYAMAWGAVVEGDPLVSDFMANCGLNASNLQGEANVDKVVEYLEARLPDDIKVVGRRYAGANDWALAKVELTIDSWIDAKTRGETKGGVEKADSFAVESALARYADACQGILAANGLTKDQQKATIRTAITGSAQVRGAMIQYTLTVGNAGMNEVVDLFISKLTVEQTAMQAHLSTL